MPLMEWCKSYELDREGFDEHHLHLLELLNRVFDYGTSGESQEPLGAVLGELQEYTAIHFSAEERWMAVHEYPGLPKHREEHEIFASRVAEILKKHHAGTTNLYPEVLLFLQNWMSHHILKTDADYGQYAQRRASPAKTVPI